MFLQGNVGGAERITVLLGKILSTKFDVRFYVINTSGLEVLNFIPKTYSTTIIDVHGQLELISKLYKSIRTEKPNVVFSSIMPVNQKILLLSRLFKRTYFIVRNDNYLYTLRDSRKLTLSITYRFADTIIAQTEEMQAELITEGHLNPNKIKVLHNPIDTDLIDTLKEKFNPYENFNGIKFVASGRFHKDKGFDVLVNAYNLVHKEIPNSKLFIIGRINDDEYSKSVKALIMELGLQNYVECLGFQNNPYPYIRFADCFVLSSRNEGLPNVLIEAQYLNKPSVATTCIPIIERIIKDGVNGYTAKVEDTTSLADAMVKAVNLHSIKSIYQPATKNDIISLFSKYEK